MGKEIYVDWGKGKDSNPGTKEKPLKTFVKALQRAKPDDVILPVRNYLKEITR